MTGYTYDALNRLSTVTYDDSSTTTYTYDAGDRLTQVVDSVAGTITRTWDGLDRLTGETTREGSIAYTYDAAGRRTTMTVAGQSAVSCGYDAADRSTSVTQGTATVSVLAGFGLDEWLAWTDGAGARYFLTDALGSTVALTDGTGAVPTAYTYEPFRATTGTGTASANGLQFTGREDDGIGLLYYRARYLAPALQRFVSEDPIEFAGGDVNLHTYASGNPTTFFDPTGLTTIVPAPAPCRVPKGKDMTPLQRFACTQVPFVPTPLVTPGLVPRFWPLLGRPFARPTPSPNTPRPPGHRPDQPWRYDYPEGPRLQEPRWFDPKGGEWRYHPADRWHPNPHWDHNPWTQWNAPWQNVPLP